MPHIGPPLHVHDEVDEIFYVLEGSYAITCGERTFDAGPGTIYRIVLALALSVAVALGAVARSGATSAVRRDCSLSSSRWGSAGSSSRFDRTGRSAPR